VKVRTKLFGGFSFIAVIGLFLGGVGIFSNQKLTVLTGEMLGLSELRAGVSSSLMSHHTWRHGLYDAVYAGIAFDGSLDPASCTFGIWERSERAQGISDPEVLSLLRQVSSPHDFVHIRARDLVRHLAEGETREAERIFRDEVLPGTQEVIVLMQRIYDRYNVLINGSVNEIHVLGLMFSATIIVFVLIALAVSVVLAMLITSSIVKPILGVTLTLKNISEGEGDLTRQIGNDSKDEIGDLSRYFDLSLEKIKHLVVCIRNEAAKLSNIGIELSSNSNETAAAINQITANIQGIKTRVINQSASVVETNATMEQVTANINKLNRSVERQTDAVSQAASALEQVMANIQSVAATLVKNVVNMENLKEASETGRVSLQDVVSDIQEIARESEGLMEINSVMENIASQTNLLSMNAAIEAAHAGEAGKGFAVVADEIRKLAESSSEQSKTIGSVLNKIKGSMNKISCSTDSVMGKFEAIDQGIKIVAEQERGIRNAMEEQSHGSRQVLQAAEQASDVTQQVKGVALEMLEGSKEVVREGSNLERVTQEISSGMNEMAAGAENINAAVNHVNQISIKNREGIETLMREVSRFKVD